MHSKNTMYVHNQVIFFPFSKQVKQQAIENNMVFLHGSIGHYHINKGYISFF